VEFGELGGAFVEVFVVGFGDSLEKCREITIASNNARYDYGFISDLIENNITIQKNAP